LQGQVLNQSNATNAMSGVGSTPYGSSVTANALGNFDTNWQNQQLGRQISGANAASPLLQAAPGLAATSAALPNQAFQNQQSSISQYLNQQLGAGEAGLGAYTSAMPTAANLATTTSAAPSNTYLSQINNVIQALNAQNTAGSTGAGAFNNLLGALGSGFSGAGNLGTGAANSLAALAGQPYSNSATIGSNALAALTQGMNIGNTGFQLPQQVLGDLQSYMGLGQSASQLSGQLGALGINELSQGIGGGLMGANALLGGGGSSGLLGSLGLAGGAGAGASDLAAFSGDLGSAALAPTAIGSSTGLGAAAGGGGGLLNLLPSLAS